MSTSSKVCSVCLNSSSDNNVCYLCHVGVCKGCIALPDIKRSTNVKFACPSCYPKNVPYKVLILHVDLSVERRLFWCNPGSCGWNHSCSKARLPTCQDWAFLRKARLKTQGLAHSNTLSLSQRLSFWIIWIPWTSPWRVLAWPVWLLESCRSPYFLWLWRFKPPQLPGVFSGIYQERCCK